MPAFSPLKRVNFDIRPLTSIGNTFSWQMITLGLLSIGCRVSIELSDRFELLETSIPTSKNDQSMPGVHTNDVLQTAFSFWH